MPDRKRRAVAAPTTRRAPAEEALNRRAAPSVITAKPLGERGVKDRTCGADAGGLRAECPARGFAPPRRHITAVGHDMDGTDRLQKVHPAGRQEMARSWRARGFRRPE